MFAFAISAVPVADIVFFVILGVALIGGLIGGLARAFKGFFIAILTILVSLLLIGVTTEPVRKLEVCQKLETSLADKVGEWGGAFTAPIYIQCDANGKPILDKDGKPTSFYVMVDDQPTTIDAVASNKMSARFATQLAKKYIDLDNEGSSLSGLAADVLADVIVEVALFVIYCIALAILLCVFRRILKKMRDSERAAVRVMNRLLGAVVAVGVAFIGMLIVFAIIRAIAGTDSAVGSYLASSPVVGKLYVDNPAAGVLTKLFH